VLQKIVVWLLATAVSIAIAVVATTFAQILTLRDGVPSLVIGLIVVGVGTNLPVIGVTVVLCLRTFYPGRSDIRIVNVAIIAALLIGLWLISDGELSRVNGTALVFSWIAGIAVLCTTARALLGTLTLFAVRASRSATPSAPHSSMPRSPSALARSPPSAPLLSWHSLSIVLWRRRKLTRGEGAVLLYPLVLVG
jgi:hypothetical protein